jgi:putative salt-induced outer membrane protein YdiY
MRTYVLSALLLGFQLLFARQALAQDPAAADTIPEITTTAELTAVWVGGNSEAGTFGAAGSSRIVWPASELKIEVGGIRTESVVKSRRAVGTPTNYSIDETSDRQRTAENYYARGRLDRQLSERFLIFTGLDWLRNTFAGIDSRILVAVGGGNTWLDTPTTRFKTDYGLTYTFQNDVVSNPFISTSFPGVRAAYDFWRKVSATAEFTSGLVADLNLENTDDVRLNFIAALPVAISAKLALKPSLQLLWRNEPSLGEIPLVSSGSAAPTGTVLVPLQKLDTMFTMAIVLNL